MPKFVCLVMKKSYHLQVKVEIAGESVFKKETCKITTPNIFLKTNVF